MQPLDTQGYSPTLEKIIRGGLEPAPPPILGSRFAFPLQSALQTVGILRKPSSMVTRALSGVQKKRFIIVGLDAAGKSTLMKKHIAKPGQEVELRYPIIGFYIRCVGDYESGNEFYTTDLGACDGHGKAVGRATCVQGDAIIWVMDSNDRDRSVEVREELFECLNLVPERLAVRQKSAGVARAVQTSPVAILINKRDLETCMNMEEITALLRPLAEKLGDRPWRMFETTITTGEGVSEAFKWVSDQLQANSISGMSEKRSSVKEGNESMNEKLL